MSQLYNRYIAGAWPEAAPPSKTAAPTAPPEEPIFTEIPAEEPAPPHRSKGLSGLKGLFGGNIKLPEFDADTVLLLVLVYFLVADETENISDTLLIIGVLLLLGF